MAKKTIDDFIRSYQERVIADPFDFEAVSALYLISLRLDKSPAQEFQGESPKPVAIKGLEEFFIPMMKPLPAIDEFWKMRGIRRRHEFYLFPGSNFSYRRPFVEGSIRLGPPFYEAPARFSSDREAISGGINTIDDTNYYFRGHFAKKDADEVYDKLLEFFNDMYVHDKALEAVGVMPDWDVLCGIFNSIGIEADL